MVPLALGTTVGTTFGNEFQFAGQKTHYTIASILLTRSICVAKFVTSEYKKNSFPRMNPPLPPRRRGRGGPSICIKSTVCMGVDFHKIILLTHGGVRPFHQTSTCLTQLTGGPCVVQIWLRAVRNVEPAKPANSTMWAGTVEFADFVGSLF